MTISEIQSDEKLRNHEFPVTREKVFLAHAGVCPLPRRVAEAIQDYARQCTLGDQETLVPAFQLRRSREQAARLIGAKPDEIAFVGPTSLGLSLVAGGLRFVPGDNVVIYGDDYPSNVYPWLALRERGVEVRALKVAGLGRIERADVLRQVDSRTRLVALASCHFIAGWRIDLRAISELLRSRGIFFCVDGIQTVGAFPTPSEHFDFMAADAHKWMLGPCAAGLLFVSEAMQERLKPGVLGWNNVVCPDYVAQDPPELQTGGRRYEAGSHNLLGLVGLNSCIELLLEVGLEAIASDLLGKRRQLTARLQARGCTVLHATTPDLNASGIVSFFKPGDDMAALHRRLENANVITSLRIDRTRQQYIRLSPHFYNTSDELDRLVDAL